MNAVVTMLPLAATRLSLLVDLATQLAREVDLDALLETACERIARAVRADRATVWLIDAERGDLVTRVAVLPEVPRLRQPLSRGIAGCVATTGAVVRLDDATQDARWDPSADQTTGYCSRSMLVVPIREDARSPLRGVLQILNREGGSFDDDDERYALALATQLGRALGMTTLRAPHDAGPGLVLRGQFNHIVGRSPAMERVFQRVARAAHSEATVLLRGETGTGKGLLARAIHVNSPRQAGPFITVDCTTLPAQLVESELFGHERGAFTGADRRVPGKVELAQGGTLLLDEVGDMPLEMQGKLLRFLQERRFERVGGRETLSADVRIVCATHRDLERNVAEGRFRQDLYYRIRVVEIEVPPLRDRGPEEVERLAGHFAGVYAQRYRRPSPELAADALVALRAHGWPGNVRELEHWIESAVVLSPDGVIAASQLPSCRRPAPVCSASGVRLDPAMTLSQACCAYAAAVVEACGHNKSRAARRLGIGRNTLARLIAGGKETTRN